MSEAGPPLAPSPGRPVVVLLHRLPDGSRHFDWLFAVDDAPQEARLRTWRSPTSPVEATPGDALALERLPDHRPRYLDYEGPISGHRGDVRRVASGRYVTEGPNALVRIAWADGPMQAWRFDAGSIARLVEVT